VLKRAMTERRIHVEDDDEWSDSDDGWSDDD